MIPTNLFYEELVENDIKFYTGVPDSLLKDICGYISDTASKKNHIISANEGSAVGLAVGYYLSTKKLPLVYLQNSGFGNTINPLLSIADNMVYGIPMVLLIGWRGEPGVKDEPQHVKQGLISEDVLKVLNIPYQILDFGSNYQNVLKEASRIAIEGKKPVAILVKKNTFSKYVFNVSNAEAFDMKREEAIHKVLDRIEDEIVVSTTGKISREVFEYREFKNQNHEKDFLTVGGMGHASQIAMGIALGQPKKNVYCFDGDGAVIMHMGSLATNGSLDYLDNFKHIVFNNEVHDSVGGQPTCAKSIDMCQIAKACGYKLILKATTVSELEEKIQELKEFKGVGFLEIMVNPGARADLGRPTTTPDQNKIAFMKFVQK